MFSRRTFSLSSLAARRFVTGLALLAYVASVTGYPLPLPVAERDVSTPYPCQGHACGCQSAAQCWENCCCYTAAERLAWVRSHGVSLPAATLASLEAEAASAKQPAKSCCSTHTKLAEQRATCEACEHDGTCAHKTERQPASSPAPRTRIGWVNGVQAQKCQGLTTLWLVSGANLPLEIPTLWEFEWTPAGRIIMANDALISLSDSPAVPPPRA